MSERAPPKIRLTTDRACLRAKSWQPEVVVGGASMVCAGAALPSRVGATVAAGELRVLCIGPGEWFLVSDTDSAATILESTETDAHGFCVVDLSDATAVVEVRGSTVRELLTKGCGLDFDEAGFPVGHCARTRFAQIQLFIDCPLQTDVFELYVARSYLSYLLAWLEDSTLDLA